MTTDYPRYLPFLLNLVNAKSLERAIPDFAHYGVTIQGARVLIAVLLNPGIRVGQLAAVTCIEPSTMSHMLRRMDRQNLIVRTRAEDDNRSVAVDLTPAGAEIAKACHKAGSDHETFLVGSMPAERVELLCSLLEELYAGIAATAA
jgi:MarR family transcriptional regulator, organic hydroperoxide resistance regulator